jgi:hypothetical protein
MYVLSACPVSVVMWGLEMNEIAGYQWLMPAPYLLRRERSGGSWFEANPRQIVH